MKPTTTTPFPIHIKAFPRYPSASDGDHTLALRQLDPSGDAPLLQEWFDMDYARFWSMQNLSLGDVRGAYQKLCDSPHANAWMGLHRQRPAFLVECYDPARDQVGEHYAAQPGDLGMHLFIGPPTERLHGFSREVFALVMRFMFDGLNAQRIVVEPDIHNTRIHALNRAMGFRYAEPVRFREKTAHLAFCTKDQFDQALLQESIQ